MILLDNKPATPTATPTELHINPGAPRRKSGSGLKFLLVIGGCLAFLFIGRLLYNLTGGLSHLAGFSHTRLYQNGSLANLNYSEVVVPLIDDEQTFDILVTVWIRRTEGQRLEWEKEQPAVNKTTVDAAGYGSWDETTHVPQWYKERNEAILYSDTVFRSVRLRDRHVFASIPLRIPTSIFRSVPVYPFDLRASFALIPTSPSPLDHIAKVSALFVHHDMPETLPYPVPRNDSDYLNTQPLRDRAITSFSAHMPLLRLLGISSRCPSDAKQKEVDIEAYNDRDMNDGLLKDISKSEFGIEEELISGTAADILRRHPYIITRTQLRIVEETHIFNRKAYDQAHKKLLRTACGKQTRGWGSFTQCHRSYMQHGNWETRLELSVPVTGADGTTTNETRYAYAPYMREMPASAGTKDFVRAPVDREDCPVDSPPAVNEEYLNVTWQLSYSGRTPGTFVLGELLPPETVVHKADMNDYDAVMHHENAEMINGLLGHRFAENAHPRRRFAASIFNWAIIRPVLGVFNVHYWYTCSSTYSISVPGTLMRAASRLIRLMSNVHKSAKKDNLTPSDWAQWLWLLITTLSTQLVIPVLMIKAVLRLTFEWKGWIPTIGMADATHLERTSQRVEARTPWREKALLLVALVVTHYVIQPDGYFFIDPAGPQSPDAFSRTEILSFPLVMTGWALQLILNHRLGYFAGWYKAAIFVDLLRDCMIYMTYIPAIFGHFEGRWGLSLADILDSALLGWTVWQVVSLPNRPSESDVDDEDRD